jgi:formylglycine-generating enzyme required for sulfatase activity
MSRFESLGHRGPRQGAGATRIVRARDSIWIAWAFGTLAMSIGTAEAAAQTGPLQRPTSGHWYAVQPTPMTWDSARAWALAAGGDLASASTPEEQRFVDFVRRTSTGVAAWIGGYQDPAAPDYAEPAGGWRWVSGAPWGFTAWWPGEPNNQSIAENRLLMLDSGAWSDATYADPFYFSYPSILEWSADCNGDGIVDFGQILAGGLADENANWIPDCCEAGESCESDCDGDGLSDAEEIAAGEGDCDANGIPDACEGSSVLEMQQLFSGVGLNPEDRLVLGARPSVGDVWVTVTGRGDFDAPDEFLTVRIDGVAIGVLWMKDGLHCPDAPAVVEWSIAEEVFNAAAADGAIVISLAGTVATSGDECPNGFISVTLRYRGTGDCDGNGVLDSCDLASGALADCDGNGIPDVCDTISADCDGDGIPDACEIDAGATDCDGNGVPDECDPDCDGDGVPDACEIAAGSDSDCNVNGVPDGCEVVLGQGAFDPDCDDDGVHDTCQIAADPSLDTNGDGMLDSCQRARGDLDLDLEIGGADLALLLAMWGDEAPVEGDLDGNGVVDSGDLSTMLASWGRYEVPWAVVLQEEPDPEVVTDPVLRQAISDTGLPWRIMHATTGLEMLLVPSGTFMMGCSPSLWGECSSVELRRHRVSLTRAFYLGRYEVRAGEWRRLMDDAPPGVNYADAALRPITPLSWTLIEDFLAASGLRLPTEAEWEFACRGGTTTAFNHGTDDDSTLWQVGWTEGSSQAWGPQVAGRRLANALGFHDMHGNLSELVADWFDPDYYQQSPPVDPTGPDTGASKVLRGGNYYNRSLFARSSSRNSWYLSNGSGYFGIRVARTP